MSRRFILMLAAALACTATMPATAQTIGTAFTYQGRIKHNGLLLTQACDLQFRLFTAATGGTQVGPIETRLNITPDKGLFTIGDHASRPPLDFGSSAFDGTERWLEIAVRYPAGAGGGDFVTLATRQRITSAPYAAFSIDGGGWHFNNGTPNFDTYFLGGNVGIGTSAPTHPLTVTGPASFAGTVGIGGAPASTYLLRVAGTVLALGQDIPDGSVSLQHKFVGAGDPAEVWSNFLGTGVSKNFYDLLGAQDRHGGFGIVHDSNTESPVAWMYGHGTNAFMVKIVDFSDSIGGSTTAFCVRNNNRVGIATTAPAERLHVSGNICATGSINTCSDERYKQQIQELISGLKIIDQLFPVRFRWRTDEFPEHDFDSHQQVGLIAQQVLPIFPEVVTLDGNGYYTIDYSRFTPLLIQGVKELHHLHQQNDRQIAQRDAIIAAQQNQIEDLSDRVAALETMMKQMAAELQRVRHE